MDRIDLLKENDLYNLLKSIIEDDFNMDVLDFDRNAIYFQDGFVKCGWYWNQYKAYSFILIEEITDSIKPEVMQKQLDDFEDLKNSLYDAVFEYKGW